MWRIWLLAGGSDAEAAARVAGLVCASADLSGLPYAITPDLSATGDQGVSSARPAACGRRWRPGRRGPAPVGGDAVADYPFCASSELVAALSRPPEREMPGIRLALRPDFDVTQELAAGRAAITVGEILDRNRRPAGPLTLPLDSLNRHVFVSGAAGSGKSQTVRALLEARHRGRDPVAGGGAGQGRVPADGGAPGRNRGGNSPGRSDPAGRVGRDRGRAQPARARGGRRGPPVPAADPRGPGQGAVHRVLPFGRALPPGAQRGADQGVRGRGLGPGPRRDGRGGRQSRLPEPDRPAAGRDQGRPGDRLQPADHRRRARLHPGQAVQPAPRDHRAGSSRAAISSTSARCSPAMPCWRSRTSATTATRPS